MSLPETIWWCGVHESPKPTGHVEACYLGLAGHDWAECRMVEVELHPVGTRAEIARTRAFFDPDGEEADDVEVV